MTNCYDKPAGWTIVSIADDGSVLCRSPAGHRRRYWFQAKDNDRLQNENDKLRELVRQAMCSLGPLSTAKWYANAAELLGRE